MHAWESSFRKGGRQAEVVSFPLRLRWGGDGAGFPKVQEWPYYGSGRGLNMGEIRARHGRIETALRTVFVRT